MKKHKILLIVVCVVFALATLCACMSDDLEGRIKVIEKTSAQAKTVTKKLTIQDGETVVYSLESVADASSDGYNVTKTETALNDSFEMATTTETATAQSLSIIHLTTENVFACTIEDNNMSCIILKENVANVLELSNNYVPNGVCDLQCVFENEKIASISCSFVTENNHTVTYLYTFSY